MPVELQKINFFSIQCLDLQSVVDFVDGTRKTESKTVFELGDQWPTQSKDLLRSQRVIAVVLPFSKPSTMPVTNLLITSTVDIFCLNPNWLGFNGRLTSKYLVILGIRKTSYILPNMRIFVIWPIVFYIFGAFLFDILSQFSNYI